MAVMTQEFCLGCGYIHHKNNPHRTIAMILRSARYWTRISAAACSALLQVWPRYTLCRPYVVKWVPVFSRSFVLMFCVFSNPRGIDTWNSYWLRDSLAVVKSRLETFLFDRCDLPRYPVVGVPNLMRGIRLKGYDIDIQICRGQSVIGWVSSEQARWTTCLHSWPTNRPRGKPP